MTDAAQLLAAAFDRTQNNLKAAGYRPSTLSGYRDTTKRLLTHLRPELGYEPNAGDFTLENVENWVIEMQCEVNTEQMKNASLRSHVRRIRAVSIVLNRIEVTTTHRLRGLVTPKREATERVRVPSRSDLNALLSACDRSAYSGRLDAALIACFADSGPRRSELLGR